MDLADGNLTCDMQYLPTCLGPIDKFVYITVKNIQQANDIPAQYSTDNVHNSRAHVHLGDLRQRLGTG